MTAITPVAAGRLLRIEIKRSVVPWVLPVLAALFLIDPFRTASGYPAVWDVRASVVLNRMLLDFVTFTAAFAAWAGSREGRRRMADLLVSTAWPAWARQAVAFAATAALFVLPFGAGVAVLYIQTARLATWGGPPLWPVAVSVLTLIAVCAVGFTAGAVFPGRLTPPLVAAGVFLLEYIAFKGAVNKSGGWALLSPSTAPPPNDAGVFYPVAPDLAIVQVMFMAGIAIAALGILVLSKARETHQARTAAIAVVTVAVALAGTAIGLAGTARQGVSGWDIPALHDAASDRPISYTPDCASGTGFQVCVHPAFSRYLDDTATALAPVAAEIAGLPGAPVRGEEVNSAAQVSPQGFGVVTGNPPVYQFNMNTMLHLSGSRETNFREDFLGAFVAPGAAANMGVPTLAQQAIVTALMKAAGSLAQFGQTPQIAAANRFAALPPAARHAWLTAHLTALRAGEITLGQLP
jgi:hypothetical protein